MLRSKTCNLCAISQHQNQKISEKLEMLLNNAETSIILEYNMAQNMLSQKLQHGKGNMLVQCHK